MCYIFNSDALLINHALRKIVFIKRVGGAQFQRATAGSLANQQKLVRRGEVALMAPGIPNEASQTCADCDVRS